MVPHPLPYRIQHICHARCSERGLVHLVNADKCAQGVVLKIWEVQASFPDLSQCVPCSEDTRETFQQANCCWYSEAADWSIRVP